MATTPVNLAVTNVLSASVRLTWEDALQALIAAIFGANEQGAFYIPRPVVLGAQALFQDSAGTVPVTADGDPVGRMLDQSGNGNHATQSVSGSRPVYRTDGTLHWLEFDGVDDFLDTDFILNKVQGSVSFNISVSRFYNFNTLFESGFTNDWEMWVDASPATIFRTSASNSDINVSYSDNFGVDVRVSRTVVWNEIVGKMYSAGVLVDTDQASFSIRTNPGNFTISGDLNTAFDGKMFNIIALDRVLTDSEIESIEEYTNY